MSAFKTIEQKGEKDVTRECADTSGKENSNTKCSVRGCDRDPEHRTTNFLRFLEEFKRRRDWLIRYGESDLLERSCENLCGLKVCSQHFEERCRNVPIYISNSLNYEKKQETVFSGTSQTTSLECSINSTSGQKKNTKPEFVYEQKKTTGNLLEKGTRVETDEKCIEMSPGIKFCNSSATYQKVVNGNCADNVLYFVDDECDTKTGIVVIPKYLDLQATCRTCLATNHLQSIYNKSSDEKIKYADMLQACSSIQVSEADQLPQLICASCVQELTRLYYFTNICRQSEKTLTCYVKHVGKQQTTDNNVQQQVGDNMTVSDQKVTSNLKNKQSKQNIDVIMAPSKCKDIEEPKKSNIKTQNTDNDEISNIDANEDNSENTNDDLGQTKEKTESDSILYSLLATSGTTRVAEDNAVERNIDTVTMNQIISVDHDYTQQTADLMELKDTSTSSASQVQSILCMTNPLTNQLEQVKLLGTKTLQDIQVMKCKIIKPQSNKPKKVGLKQQAHSIPNSKLKQYECQHCDKKFYTLVGLNQHRCLEHVVESAATSSGSVVNGSSIEPFKCDVCQKQFGNNAAYRTHLNVHQTPKFLCNECGKLFKENEALQQHLRAHAGDLRHECTECGRRFMTRSILKEHMHTHERQHRGEKPYACSKCEYHSASMANLKDHVKIHITNREHICMQCTCSFSTVKRLWMHEDKVHTKNGFACSHQGCGARLSTTIALRQHILIHYRRHKCPLCKSTFFLKGSVDIHVLREHAVYATDEQPGEPGQYHCPACEMQYDDLRELAEHDQVHVTKGDRTYYCEECRRTFGSEFTFERHIDRMHRPRPYECNECGKKFTARSGLYIHRQLHSGWYVCQYCNRPLAERQQFVDHMCTHIGKQPHVCLKCGMVFSLERRLTEHKRREHT